MCSLKTNAGIASMQVLSAFSEYMICSCSQNSLRLVMLPVIMEKEGNAYTHTHTHTFKSCQEMKQAAGSLRGEVARSGKGVKTNRSVK